MQHESHDIDGEILCAFLFYWFTLLTLSAAGFWMGLSAWKMGETGGKDMFIPGSLAASGMLLLRVSVGVFGLNKRAKDFAYGAALTSFVVGAVLSSLLQRHTGFVLSFFLWDIPLAVGFSVFRWAQKKRTKKGPLFVLLQHGYNTRAYAASVDYCIAVRNAVIGARGSVYQRGCMDGHDSVGKPRVD